jgi:outer membrane lipoprotein
MRKYLCMIILVSLLAGCAVAPFDMKGVNQGVTPQLAQAGNSYQGQQVVWGGMIIKTDVLKNMTRIEVLAFPVDNNGKPNQSAAAQGRFMVNHAGFLEPADYAAGRWISVLGDVGKNLQGKVGEAQYTFPVIEARQMHLWAEETPGSSNTRFHFGIGIRL